MYGGTHKFGRGGGGGGGQRGGGTHNKRNSFPPPPQRPSSTSNYKKLPSISSSRNKSKPSSTSTSSFPPSSTTPATNSSSSPQSEESFSLISSDPPAFAAIIRLAPDLVDEIKRAESLSIPPQIKFHSNPTNTSENVIDVGGKEFRFTWSHDVGGLCDIYEERQNGEDGNGLLVESGCSWRKLNVQRVLDESTKKHVKKRSEEYEQKLKSRKAIVLDQCNPSMKSQMQALAAAEASPWKFKPKNKRHFEAPQQVVGHPKPVKSTTGLSSTSSAKGRHSTSPLPSPLNQSISLTSASVRGNPTESQTVAELPTTIHSRAKENAFSYENVIPTEVSGGMLEASVQKKSQGAGISDLQNVMVSLLKENPKGMSIKALEKAVGDMSFNSVGKIEPILKKIATYEPPGRYVLKPGLELETLKKTYTDSGSPDGSNQKQFVPDNNDGEVPALDEELAGKFSAEDLEEPVQKFDDESHLVEKYDTSQHFSDLFGDDEPPGRSEGQTARTNGSESGSDSDSGSSDSSDSASRSRSPAGSDSASSSDSDGDDSSSNSKEASDVDVNITSDDDKEAKKLQGSELGFSTTPIPWSMPEAMPPQDGTVGGQDGYVSEDVDIENDFLDDIDGKLAIAPQHTSITTEKIRTISPDHDLNQPCDRIDVFNEKEDSEDEYQHQHHSFVKSGGKSKRGSNMIQFGQDDSDVKRLKANTAQLSVSRHTGSRTLGSPSKFSADNEENRDSHDLQISNEVNRDDNANAHPGAQKGYNYNVSGKSAVQSLQSGRKPSSHSYNIEAVDKVVKNPPNLGVDSKFKEANAYTHEDKGYRDAQDEEDSSIMKANGNIKEVSLDQKHSSLAEAHLKKHGERSKKSHSLGTTRLQSGSSLNNGVKADFDRSPADRRRLQREPSELELGELREPLSKEPEGTKRQFERGGSFKQSDTKLGSLASRNAELKGKPMTKPILDSVNTISPNARGAPNNSETSSRRRSPEPIAEDSCQPHGVLQSQLRQSRNGPVESLSNKAVDQSKLGHTEVVANQGADVEGYGETKKKSRINSQREDSRKESSSRKGRGSKSKKSNTSKECSDRRKDVSHSQGHNNKRKRRESSSDENDSYAKYEKEEPELKGPIKSFSQYKEYVQEYHEKYESYSSLNKILEGYRSEFQKMGMDLDSAKGRDTERYFGILAQLRDSYRRCGMRHKRLKKIFLVLHEELKQLKQMIKDFAVDYIKD